MTERTMSPESASVFDVHAALRLNFVDHFGIEDGEFYLKQRTLVAPTDAPSPIPLQNVLGALKDVELVDGSCVPTTAGRVELARLERALDDMILPDFPYSATLPDQVGTLRVIMAHGLKPIYVNTDNSLEFPKGFDRLFFKGRSFSSLQHNLKYDRLALFRPEEDLGIRVSSAKKPRLRYLTVTNLGALCIDPENYQTL